MKHLTIPEFACFFSTFKKTAFRFETRPAYDVSQEVMEYNAFLKGEKPDPNFGEDWHRILRREGTEFRRVRLIQTPPTDYIKFEINWCYGGSRKAGEGIRFLINNPLEDFKKDVPILKDFWLFDSKDLLLMDYDYIGRFFGAHLVPEELVPSYVSFAQKLWASSLPFEEGQRACEKR